MKKMEEDRIPRRKIEKLVGNASRQKGRPRRRWANEVKWDLEGRGIQWRLVEEDKVPKDRNRWRGLVNSQTKWYTWNGRVYVWMCSFCYFYPVYKLFHPRNHWFLIKYNFLPVLSLNYSVLKLHPKLTKQTIWTGILDTILLLFFI